MGYAVELYFDRKTERIVKQLRQELYASGIASTLDSLGDRPHISFAIFHSANPNELAALVLEFAQIMKAFEIQLSAVGTFLTNENVLFLTPSPTLQLLNYHRVFHQLVGRSNLVPSPYYTPGSWVPHCSVEMNIPDEQLPAAINICKNIFKPLTGQIEEIGVVEFRPVKTLATWLLVPGVLQS